MARILIVVADLIFSFMWIWSGVLIKIFVNRYLELESETEREIVKGAFVILNLFFFVWLGKISGGGSYNPLTVVAGAISGSFTGFLFAICARIPAQVIGSIIGVWLVKETFTEIGHGPRLNVDLHIGALTEGILTFTIVFVSLSLSWKDPNSFFMKAWISSVTKLALHILGSDLTGGCMNPASAIGWAYARGDHITKEHLFVYWLAPLEATLLSVWTFKLLVQPHKLKQHEEKADKKKSD